jgi:hypothetical protein
LFSLWRSAQDGSFASRNRDSKAHLENTPLANARGI